MAFPINPTNGQIYGIYTYKSSPGIWERNGFEFKEQRIAMADSGDVKYLYIDSVGAGNVLGTVPTGKAWYLFQIWASRSETTGHIHMAIRNESNVVQHGIYASRSYAYGVDELHDGIFDSPFKLTAGWNIWVRNTAPGFGLYYKAAAWVLETDA